MKKKDYLILAINLFLPIIMTVYMLYLGIFGKIDTILNTSVAVAGLCLQMALWSLSMLIDNNAFSKKSKRLEI